jgi:hypothetical protein
MKFNFSIFSLCGDTRLGIYEAYLPIFSLCGGTSLGIYEA